MEGDFFYDYKNSKGTHRLDNHNSTIYISYGTSYLFIYFP